MVESRVNTLGLESIELMGGGEDVNVDLSYDSCG